MLRGLIPIASLVELAACCLSVTGPPDAGQNPPECASVGGTCVIGPPSNCVGTVLTAYDCNPERNPAALICCLFAIGDAGVDGGNNVGQDSGPVCTPWPPAGACEPGPASDLATFTTFATSTYLVNTVSADVNGDGVLDLVALERDVSPEVPGGSFDVFFGEADGGLLGPVRYAGSDGFGLAVGDLNRDGIPDVAVSDGFSVNLFVNDGCGGLTSWKTIAVATNTVSIYTLAIADLNADGFPDLLFTETPTDSSTSLTSLEVLWGHASAVFSGPDLVATLWQWAFAVGDLNRDGLPDIVATTAENQVAVMLNQGDGGFQTSVYPAHADAMVFLPNARDAPDIVLGSFYQNKLQILENSGDGTFSMGPVLASYGQSIAIGDFNGDCIPDIAASWQPGPCRASAAVFLGESDGGLDDPISLDVGDAGFGFPVPMGPVENPRALAGTGFFCGTGITVYGDASRH
jgi:hypothetical protein